jgi:arylsulfatase A-like enzyme
MMKTTKRSLSLICAAILGAAVRVEAQAPSRPNIVLMVADDHAWQAISAYGDSRHLINTPNIDRLATEGMRFDRCLVTNALCGPSRAAILTGTYSHINGFYNNVTCRFDGSQITFPKLLQQAGYQTAMIGKWHLESAPTGFDHWEVLPGGGVYYNPTMFLNGEKVVHPGYVTDVITDRSIEWLQKRDPSKPFLLCCWGKSPHREWEPALRDLEFDHDREYPLPETLFDDYSGRGLAEHDQNATIQKAMRFNEDLKLSEPGDLNSEQRKVWRAYYGPRNEAFLKALPTMSEKQLTQWKYNRFMHDYLGCVKGTDDNVGKILKYLDEAGLSKNTIVIYSSDQGYFLGEHGWFDKRWIFQESVRAPLLIRWPGVTKAGSVNKAIVSNLDFAQTCLQAAGVECPERMQGSSLVPLMQGQTPEHWRSTFYYHYYEYPAYHRVRPQYGLVTDRYTLVHFYKPDTWEKSQTALANIPNDYWELFDREKDPGEMRDVFSDPAYADIRNRLMLELRKERSRLKEPEKVDPKAYGSPDEWPQLTMPNMK